jgi:hypothetical protein
VVRASGSADAFFADVLVLPGCFLQQFLAFWRNPRLVLRALISTLVVFPLLVVLVLLIADLPEFAVVGLIILAAAAGAPRTTRRVKIAIVQDLPMGLAVLLRCYHPRLARVVIGYVGKAANILFIILALILVVSGFDLVVAAGHLPGGPDAQTRTTLATATIARNMGLRCRTTCGVVRQPPHSYSRPCRYWPNVLSEEFCRHMLATPA